MRDRSKTISPGGQKGPMFPSANYVTSCEAPNFNPESGVAENSKLYWDYEVKSTQDEVNENFHKRIANGEIINSPFSMTHVKVVEPVDSAYSHVYVHRDWTSFAGEYYDLYYHISGTLAPRPDLGRVADFLGEGSVSLDVSSISNAAVTQAYANIDVSEMQALATAAESRKSMDSMLAILLRLRKVVRAFRRLDYRALRNELSAKELANRYMELRYAIRPLIYDAQGIARAVNKKREHIRRTFTGYSEGSGEASDVVTLPLAWAAQADWDRKTTVTASARAGVLCSVNVDAISVFGVDQVVETMWELVPLSFIVDWFVSVGDSIAALTPNAGVNQQASWVTVKKIITETCTVRSVRSVPTNAEPVSISYGGATRTRVTTTLNRSINPELSAWPTFNMKLDGYKLADLGIILKRMVS